MLRGDELVADIDAAEVKPGQVAFWWLGQHSFILKMGRHILYVDPYLTEKPSRLVPPLVTPKQMAHADLVLGTHDHSDHIDRKFWPDIAQQTKATFVVPDLVRKSIIEDQGISGDRIFGLDDGTSLELDGVRIRGVAAAHEFLDQDLQTGRYPYLGLVIEANGAKVYHAGDTVKYEGLETRVKKHVPIDLALLPINGRDAKRLASGTVGNMTYQEAVDLAGAIEPQLTIPTHYDMFAHNQENPQLFVEYAQVKFPELKVMVCPYGVRVDSSRGL